jgi:putative endonuclease
MDKYYYVYILTTRRNTVLYTGVTSDLVKRIFEHKNHSVPGFTQRYCIHKLVYYETYTDPINAIAREKQIKAGSRKKKTDLIRKINPAWRDLYEEIAG